MLQNFDVAEHTITTTVPVVTDRVSVVLHRSEKTAYLATEKSQWTWRELRDYVVAKIEERHGPFPRDEMKEKAIFNSFLERWGEKAVDIAEFAFGFCDGMWCNAPISVNRFCKGSDIYFAQPIADRL